MIKKPWSVQIELVEGCNRLCSFCGLNGIRTRAGQDLIFMSFEIVEAIAMQAAELCPTARFEFAMHGEPTLHPDLYYVLEMFRDKLPDAQFQLTTNGKTLLGRMRERLEMLFLFVDIVLIDTYYPERDRLHKEAFTLDGIDVWDFYEDGNVPSPWHNHRRKLNNTVILMDDISARSGESKARVLNNQGGNVGTGELLHLKKVCTLPFREIAIRQDGDVCICCVDVGHEFVCGNVLSEWLEDIWFGNVFEAIRKELYQRRRLFSPCARCDSGAGSRAGFLPKYDSPMEVDIAIINNTLRNCEPRNGREQVYIGI